MTDYLAHSARDDRPPQSYRDHVDHVRAAALQNAQAAARFAAKDGPLLLHAVETAARVHDLGKLLDENQAALHQPTDRKTLPVNHVDAGVACLRRCEGDSLFAQAAVYSHHHGLPGFPFEENRGADFFRDQDPQIRKLVNERLDDLNRRHQQAVPDAVPAPREGVLQGDNGVFCRLMLSCLADADHADTAAHYGKYPMDMDAPALRAEERLQRLDEYVRNLEGSGERARLRSEMYEACRDSSVFSGITACDSPVGSGKTTAVMAHLLAQAVRRKARRIFVVLPFTNIIQQSVEKYRESLLLPGENPEAVVAELHHRADFENDDLRALTAQWRAPIIVTTAVAFFETLASNRPAALRRLHELPGSLIFVDEAHAALPVKLLPLAWRWMQVLADEWQCYWVLASGSLVRFWDLNAADWRKQPREVPQILTDPLRKRLMGFERTRIKFSYIPRSLSRNELVGRVTGAPGPRLLIMNTVQSAAVMAMDLQSFYGGKKNKVMHLSTALNAEDRAKTVSRIRTRLDDTEDTDWTLVATSCVEAGVDFSFMTGFREMASLLSLLQAAGRVNRGGTDDAAEIWSFMMQEDAPLLKSNPGVKTAAGILKRFFENDIRIQPGLSTESMQRELDLSAEDLKSLLQAEEDSDFPAVRERFRVIDADTVLTVADDLLKEQLRNGNCDWRVIQRKAVSVRRYYATKFDLPALTEGLYEWRLGYDDFLGIMKGVLNPPK